MAFFAKRQHKQKCYAASVLLTHYGCLAKRSLNGHGTLPKAKVSGSEKGSFDSTKLQGVEEAQPFFKKPESPSSVSSSPVH